MRRRLEQRARSSDRIDDNPDTVIRRLQTFKENNALVMTHVHKRGAVHLVSRQIVFRLKLILTLA